MVLKRKYVDVTLNLYKAFQELEKVKSTKDVTAKWKKQPAWKKNEKTYDKCKLYITKSIKSECFYKQKKSTESC